MSKTIVAVLGAGSWGTALANVVAENGHDVRLWTHRAEQADEINNQHTNSKYMGDNPLNEKLVATADMQAAVLDAEIVLSVVPTQATRQVASQLNLVLQDLQQEVTIVGATKGIEPETYKLAVEMITEEVDPALVDGVAVIAGPSHAEGVIKHDPTLVTAVSEDLAIAERVQEVFSNATFRVYTNDDVIGSELAGALKNVVAIGAGALDSLGYDANAKAALFTRGLAEIARLGQAFGADPITFMGLAGVGDLFATATSVHSRNFRAGYQLGEGKSLAEVVANMGMVIEGISTTKVAYELAQQKHVDMPITEAIYQVLYEDVSPDDAIAKLMGRAVQKEGK